MIAALLAFQFAAGALSPPPPPPAVDAAASPGAVPLDPMDRRYRLLDVSADVLPRGSKELSLFWGNLAWGIAPKLQVSSDLAGDAVGLLNLGVRVQLLESRGMRATAEVAGAWWALAALAEAQVASVPLELRASIPLFENFELSLGARFSWLLLHLSTLNFNSMTFGTDAVLVRYDRRGAFLLHAKLPLLAGNAMSAQEVLGVPSAAGSLWFDDSRGWSLMFARDQRLGERVHVRLGLGYRERPGVLVLESLGNLMVSANVRWRF